MGALFLAAGAGRAGAQADPVSRFECPPVVAGAHSVVNASNPTDSPADLQITVFGKAGGVVLSKTLRLAPGKSESVDVRFANRSRRLLRARIVQLGGEPGILGTFQGLPSGPNDFSIWLEICPVTTPNRPF
jgi:hypothetical protein